jgi:hypothetical protein
MDSLVPQSAHQVGHPPVLVGACRTGKVELQEEFHAVPLFPDKGGPSLTEGHLLLRSFQGKGGPITPHPLFTGTYPFSVHGGNAAEVRLERSPAAAPPQQAVFPDRCTAERALKHHFAVISHNRILYVIIPFPAGKK